MQLFPYYYFSLDNSQLLFQVQATDFDIGDNGRISYSILPPYDNLFLINNQGEVFNSDVLNQSLDYHIHIMAIDHGKPKQLNSTQDCYIKILTKKILSENENISSLNEKKMFNLTLFNDYSYIIIGLFIFFLFIILILITICLTFCLHSLFFHKKKSFKQENSRQFNYYDTVQRKTSFIHDESACSRSSKLDDNDDITSEERERLVNFNHSDQTSCESSDSMHKQIRILNKVKQNSITNFYRFKERICCFFL